MQVSAAKCPVDGRAELGCGMGAGLTRGAVVVVEEEEEEVEEGNCQCAAPSPPKAHGGNRLPPARPGHASPAGNFGRVAANSATARGDRRPRPMRVAARRAGPRARHAFCGGWKCRAEAERACTGKKHAQAETKSPACGSGPSLALPCRVVHPVHGPQVVHVVTATPRQGDDVIHFPAVLCSFAIPAPLYEGVKCVNAPLGRAPGAWRRCRLLPDLPQIPACVWHAGCRMPAVKSFCSTFRGTLVSKARSLAERPSMF